jgi:hypothetical protein
MIDIMCGDFCPFSLPGRLERVQGTMVYLCLSFPYPFLIYHSNQVSFPVHTSHLGRS